MYKDNKSFGQMKNAFFNSFKEDNFKCLEPEEKCTGVPINSHSIQDSRILSKLAKDQHVIYITSDLSPVQQSRIGEYKEPSIKFDKISIHTATTFRGLCSDHDTKMFLPTQTI